MTQDRLSLELHIVQNFAPSNLNRDDVGSPKDCVFGGVRRARISSQAFKRAIRTHEVFRNTIAEAGGDLGVRTRLLKAELHGTLQKEGVEDEDERSSLIDHLVTKAFGLSFSKKREGETEYLLYIGRREIEDLTKALLEHRDAIINDAADAKINKKLKSVVSDKNKTYAADVALFGRMVADDKTMNVDASCQVAHSISTHRVDTDIDYFTAVDDLNPESETGAGMIGQVELNGSCHYRYLDVDILSLWNNLGHHRDLTAATVDGLLAAAVLAIPTGKQNSTAAQNPPYYVRAVLRDDGKLWSLAGAFSSPVTPGSTDGSYEEESVARLESYFEKLSSAYGLPEDALVAVTSLRDEAGMSFDDLRSRVKSEVERRTDSWGE